MRALLISLSPRARLAAACGLVLALAALAPVGGTLVASAALVALGAWLLSRGGMARGLLPPEPLRVVSRAGLSPRCGLALVEVEGRRYLVAFGDSFATIRSASAPEQEEGTSC
jgi:flagellar protein FliO/FliZ